MAKKVKGGEVKFKVTSEGLNKVGKDAKNTGKQFNTLDKNARSTDRAMKGVSNMSSNTTKNFSKMSQGITGGLVPAYATLAAQLFALDALFRFLKEAADFRVLQEGQEAFAGVTGRAMKTLARDIQSATEAQITFKEASQAAAIGLAAGLNPSQLNQFGEAAKTISVALGRDVTDSFNRLVRGVTKAEPELLDELGIILRLDEATTKYAAQLGTTKEQLTTFQKSQAVANDVLEQAETRYGAINQLIGGDSINQLAKLQVAFDEVLNRIRSFIGPIAEFFGTFLTENINSATAAVGIFAASISRGLINQAIPTIDTAGAAEQVQSNLKNFLVKGPKGSEQEARRKRVLKGRGTKQDLAVLDRSLNAQKSKIVQFENVSRTEAKRTFSMIKLQRQQMVVDSSVGFKRMGAQFKMELMMMQMTHGKVMGTMRMATVMAGRAMNAALRFAGIIGILFMLVDVFRMIKDAIFPVDETLQGLIDRTEELTSTQEGLNKELDNTVRIFQMGLLKETGQQIEQIGGAFQSADLTARLSSYEAMVLSLGRDHEAVKALSQEISGTIRRLSLIDASFAEMIDNAREMGLTDKELIPLVMKHTSLRVEQGQAVSELNRAQQNTLKQLNKLTQQLPKVPFQEAINAISEEVKILEKLNKTMGIDGVDATLEYSAQLDLAAARLKKFKIISEQQFMIQKQVNETLIAAERATAMIFGDAQRVKNAQKFATAMGKLLDASTNVLVAENNLSLAQQSGDETRIANAERALDLSKQQLELEVQRLATIQYQSSELLQAYKSVFETLEKDLGSAFGKVLRGESGAFKDFGKNIAKKITDALGDNMAKFQLKLMFGGTPLDPDYQRETFVTALKKEFAAGFSDPNSPFMQGGHMAATMIKEGMIQAAQAHVSSLGDFQLADLEARHAQNVIDYNTAKGLQDDATANLTAYDDTMKDLDRVRDRNQQLGGSGPGSIEYETNRLEGMLKKLNPFADSTSKGSMFAGTYAKLGDADFDAEKYFDALQKQIGQAQYSTAGAFLGFANTKRGNPFYDMGEGPELITPKMIADRMNQSFFPGSEVGGTKGNMGYGSEARQKYLAMLNEEGDERAKLGQEIAHQKVLVSGLNKEYDTNLDRLDNSSQEIALASERQIKAEQSINGLTIAADGAEATMNESEAALTGFKESTVTSDAQIQKLGFVADETAEKMTRHEMKLAALAARFPTIFAKEDHDNDDTTPEVHKYPTMAKFTEFGSSVAEFGGFVAMGMSMAGENEKAAKLMQRVAQLQFSLLVAEKALAFGKGFNLNSGAGFFSRLGDAFSGMLGLGRYGGVFSGSGKSFKVGGVADGPESGYGAVLHGTEAVVPLGNDRTIPVKLSGAGGTNNVSVTVNVDQSGTDTLMTGDGGRELGETIAAIATDVISKEQRAGGLLSSI